MKALDAFCGAGGMSDGMAAAGWSVVGSDIVKRPEYRHRFIDADIRSLSAEAVEAMHGGPVDWAHGSPPCQRFSTARGAGYRDDPPTSADLDLVRAFLDLKDDLEPRFWSVENVRGSLNLFSELMGPPRLRHGPFYLWGNFPGFLVARAGLTKGIKVRGVYNPRRSDPWWSARLPEELTVPMARAIAASNVFLTCRAFVAMALPSEVLVRCLAKGCKGRIPASQSGSSATCPDCGRVTVTVS